MVLEKDGENHLGRSCEKWKGVRRLKEEKNIIIIFIYYNWVVTRWQWLFYMYTKHEIGY